MTTIYYLILLVLTALGSSIMTSYAPAMLTRLKRVFTRTKHTPNVYCDDLSKRIDDLQSQIDNIAETVAIRDRNRRYNIRYYVKEYLNELRK